MSFLAVSRSAGPTGRSGQTTAAWTG